MRKQEHLHTPPFPTIQAWDRDYYCPPEPPAPPIPLPRLTFGTVLMGLSRLFRHLYGIHLRPVKPIAGEVWHSDVHKLEVVDEEKVFKYDFRYGSPEAPGVLTTVTVQIFHSILH